ncbi:MAG: SUMF1/EgtB/PvdO family nonheme iron enzyme [Planctomycetota bacterium]|nr:SUMF1/EgtB/PvdO family nonheme iron enzyme [Planctomycetota bacterium]
MISARDVTMMAVMVAMVLLAVGVAAFGQTHAPWPTNWNNWSDPALWVTVGNPGNAADTRYATPGYGSVGYTYNIGKFEVTAGQYTAFLNALVKTDAYGLYNTRMDSYSYGCKITRHGSSGNYTYDFSGRPSGTEADWANRPVNFVSWGDAARFANWLTNGQPTGVLTGIPSQDAGLTEDGSYYLNGAISDAALLAVTRKTNAKYVIPTEDEWYKAAYHKNDGVTGNYFVYPTGSDSVPSHDLVTPDPGNNANFQYKSEDTIGSPYYRTLVGEFENSESPYGTFDQGGNIWEWNEAIIDGSYRGLLGGTYFNGSGYLRASGRFQDLPSIDVMSFGFRVSEVPEPATMSLLALGGAALVVRRKKN